MANGNAPAPPTATPAGPNESLATIPTGGSPIVIGSDAYRGGLEPTNLNDAYQLAQMIAQTGICGVTSPEDALTRILTGRGLGLSAMQSLRGVYVVKGRPSLDASLMQALCMKSPICEYFECVSTDETQATYRTKRVGRPERVLTFTIEDAARQGLVGRGDDAAAKDANNYAKIPKEMLRARAKSSLARLEYPDLMFGMYSREELISGADAEDVTDSLHHTADQIKKREREIEVEIIRDKPAAVYAAPRDYAGEAEAFKVRIRAATTRQARAEVRDALQKWDGVEPFRGELERLYNETRPTKATAAAPDAQTVAPAVVGDGNLFAGKEPAKP